ncbi:MAG TPA: tetratricopeptide repeat protein [Pseudonocardiaceae bacterium]|jgi:tetratricopeptide (TPR) repeat protein/transcriptional regulator with XRE-family HTH domain|nr:tetratricopeptide repeat protein [Pseudonocardiaceae bacterium]
MTDASFGAELRRLRGAAGLSLTDLANKVHYSKGYLSKVETGLAQANGTLAALCDGVLDTEGTLVAMVPSRRKPRGRPRGPVARLTGLPPDAAHFTGRTGRLAELRAALLDEGPGVPTVCVVAGMAGVGKTALAVHVAHQIEDHFPDGSLFLDLRGYTPGGPGVSSAEALDRLLRLLGIPGEQIPADTDDRAAYYRGRLRTMRLLLVLDNASSAQQIRQLLPGERSCRVIVTSRGRLPALDDARHISLDALTEDEATTLFTAVAGTERSCAPPRAEPMIGNIVAHCGRLPLAVRIAAARYRGNPGWSLADLDARLADATALLRELDDGERSVVAAFQLSYRDLPADQRRLLALLALHPGPDIDTYSAAALGDLELVAASGLLDRLQEAYLLGQQAGGRYEFHDLLRIFARAMAEQDLPAPQRRAALDRLVEYGLRGAESADILLTPHRFRPPIDHGQPPRAPRTFTDATAAMNWIQAEWRTLVALCAACADNGEYARCWQLAFLLRGYFFLAKLWDPWIETHQLALRAARAAGDLWAQGVTLNNLGVAHIDRGEIDTACAYYQQALAIFDELDDEPGRVNALANLGWAHHYRAEHDLARHDLRAALAAYRRAGNDRNAAITLRGLSLAETELGEYTDAEDNITEALRVFDRLGLDLDAVMAYNCLGWTHFRAGRHSEAAKAYRQAVTRGERAGSQYEIARAETGLGNVAAAQDRRAEAERYWERALQRYPDLNATVMGEARTHHTIAAKA